MSTKEAWLAQHRHLYGDSPNGLLALSSMGSFAATMVPANDPEAAWRYAERKGFRDIYFRICPVLNRRYESWERGKKADSLEAPALWLDVDVAGGVHKIEGLPTAREAGALIRALLHPTLIVRTGGGVHCYWRLDEPLRLQGDAPGTLDPAGLAVFDRWVDRWLGAFAEHGWHIDAGVARTPSTVLRMAGTFNAKREPLVEVTIQEEHERSYSLDEILDFAPARVRNGRAPRLLATDAPGVAEARRAGGPLAKRVNRTLPLYRLLEEVWGLHEEGDRWVYPSPDGELVPPNAAVYTDDDGIQSVTAFGVRLQQAWGLTGDRHSLRAWDLLVLALGISAATTLAKTLLDVDEDALIEAAAASVQGVQESA